MRWLPVLFLSLAVSGFAQTQNSSVRIGRVSGVVLDEQGRPLAQASICATQSSTTGTATTCSWNTDEKGRFRTTLLEAGSYEMSAVKDEEGYTSLNQSPGQKLTISTETTNQEIVIHLKPKGAIVEGSVKDRDTGQRLDHITVSYYAPDRHMNGSMECNSDFKFTLPTSVDLIFVVTARGHRSWFYMDENSRPLLRMGSGEKKTLDIQLEPQDDSGQN
jgi:uncharacterized surface anchored protein